MICHNCGHDFNVFHCVEEVMKDIESKMFLKCRCPYCGELSLYLLTRNINGEK